MPHDRDLGRGNGPAEAAARGDVFVFPSIGEAFGLAVVEMMSFGKIVIGFRSGAFPEIIEHGKTGFLIDPFDYRAANRILRDLRENPEKKAAIQAAAREAAKKYAPAVCAARFFAELNF